MKLYSYRLYLGELIINEKRIEIINFYGTYAIKGIRELYFTNNIKFMHEKIYEQISFFRKLSKKEENTLIKLLEDIPNNTIPNTITLAENLRGSGNLTFSKN